MQKVKSILSKINFSLARNPIIEKYLQYERFIPRPFKTVVLISADFELAWASRYSKKTIEPYELTKMNAKRERSNLPLILELCDAFYIPVTWATVGHLFLDKCDKINGMAHPEIKRLPYFENEFWRYDKGDWFEYDPCTNYQDDPEWYAYDIIKNILTRKVRHEIGCHTFSHIDCRDDICSAESMRSELQACKRLADEWKIELKSFVHPAHTIGNLDTLAQYGFTNFRTNYRNVLGYPKKHKNGLWKFEQTAEFVYRKAWSVKYHIQRYKEIIKRAVKTNTVCILWFHPSFDAVVVDRILPPVFAYIRENRDQIWVATHREYVDWLERNR